MLLAVLLSGVLPASSSVLLSDVRACHARDPSLIAAFLPRVEGGGTEGSRGALGVLSTLGGLDGDLGVRSRPDCRFSDRSRVSLVLWISEDRARALFGRLGDLCVS